MNVSPNEADRRRWEWARYNLPGLLVGPVRYIESPRFPGALVPDYDAPGVALRIQVEIDFIEDMPRRY